MYIIQPVFCQNQYKISYNSHNNIENNISFNNLFYKNADFAKASAENYKANYMVNFKGGMKYTNTDSNEIGRLNHQTAFFREPQTDEIVQDYILEKFGKDKEINIVSGACSTGEEAKSYAMMLDTLKDKLKIVGFDISPEVVKEAQSNSCQLTKYDDVNSLVNTICLNSENILLTDDIDNLTNYEKKCRNKFKQYYHPKGLPHKVSVFPNAKQELEDLEKQLSDKEEFEKLKEKYNEQMDIVRSMSPELSNFIEGTSFEDTIKIGKLALEKQVETYQTVSDFEAEEHAFDNCYFVLGDVINIENMFEPESINALLYRNALYHTLCKGNDMIRFMNDDAQEKMDSIAKQMNKILKNKGLVVFGKNEYMQGIDTSIIKETMENNGFKLLQREGKDNDDNIWVKCKDI